MLRHILLLFLFVLSMVLSSNLASVASASMEPIQNNIKIVVDAYHSHNHLEPLTEDNMYEYHNEYGSRHLFDYLKDRGVVVEQMTTGPIGEKSLANASMLFINLTSMDLPPFRVSEIKEIKQYIENGGGLMVITDHTNCYFHAYKLSALFEELGIDIHTETACDVKPNTIASGNGWIWINRFKAHPITQGIETIAMQTGGTVDDRYGVAFTSDKAWGDQWIAHPFAEGDTPGFYGNWEWEKGERTGRLAVMMAKKLGNGRIVVFGDQNMWGDPFCNYADNYKLWLNSVAWLTGEKQLADPALYQQWKKPRILSYESYPQAVWGNDDEEGLFNLFVAMGRRHWTFASNDLSGDADLIIFAHDRYTLPDATKAALIKHLKSGRNVIIMGSLPKKEPEQLNLVSQIIEKLGTPSIQAEQKQVRYQWAGYGSVIMLEIRENFLNEFTAEPEEQPTSEQKAQWDYFMKIVADNLKK